MKAGKWPRKRDTRDERLRARLFLKHGSSLHCRACPITFYDRLARNRSSTGQSVERGYCLLIRMSVCPYAYDKGLKEENDGRRVAM
jgi:hypothetical protein